MGDILQVQKDTFFPADLLLLSVPESADGLAYVETINLDGESNLKIKKALDQTQHVTVKTLQGFTVGVCNKSCTHAGTPNLRRSSYKQHKQLAACVAKNSTPAPSTLFSLLSSIYVSAVISTREALMLFWQKPLAYCLSWLNMRHEVELAAHCTSSPSKRASKAAAAEAGMSLRTVGSHLAQTWQINGTEDYCQHLSWLPHRIAAQVKGSCVLHTWHPSHGSKYSSSWCATGVTGT